MPEQLRNILLLLFAGLAIWGAFDYIVESVQLFRRSLRRYLERHRD
jgi:hypothetical protein